jgi:hypothetical protein
MGRDAVAAAVRADSLKSTVPALVQISSYASWIYVAGKQLHCPGLVACGWRTGAAVHRRSPNAPRNLGDLQLSRPRQNGRGLSTALLPGRAQIVEGIIPDHSHAALE